MVKLRGEMMAQKESVASKDEITKSMCPLLLFLRFLGLDLTSSKPRCVILNVLHAIFSFIFIVYLVILSVQSVSGFGEKYEIGFMYYFMRATSVFLYISWTASYLQLAWHRNNFNTFFEMLQTFMSTITENKQKLCRKAKILSFLLLIYNFIILIFTLLSGYNNILNGLTENICYPPKLIIAAVGKRASCMVEFSWLICSQGYLKIVYSFITFLFCVISFHLSFCFKFIRDEAATLKSKLAYNSTRATELMKKYSIATDLVQMFDKLYEEIIFGCISMELGEIIVYSRLLSDKKHIAVKVLYMYEICTSVFCMFILFIAASFVNSEKKAALEDLRPPSDPSGKFRQDCDWKIMFYDYRLYCEETLLRNVYVTSWKFFSMELIILLHIAGAVWNFCIWLGALKLQNY